MALLPNRRHWPEGRGQYVERNSKPVSGELCDRLPAHDQRRRLHPLAHDPHVTKASGLKQRATMLTAPNGATMETDLEETPAGLVARYLIVMTPVVHVGRAYSQPNQRGIPTTSAAMARTPTSLRHKINASTRLRAGQCNR